MVPDQYSGSGSTNTPQFCEGHASIWAFCRTSVPTSKRQLLLMSTTMSYPGALFHISVGWMFPEASVRTCSAVPGIRGGDQHFVVPIVLVLHNINSEWMRGCSRKQCLGHRQCVLARASLAILRAQFFVATMSIPVTRKEFMMKLGNREIAL
jgi:hypothetical protein